MEKNIAEKAKDLVILRHFLLKEYDKKCKTFNINVIEHGESMIDRIRIALWQEINEINKQIEKL